MSQDLATKEIRYAWLQSQMRWHKRRARESKWHLNQFRWYRRKSMRVFTFTDLVVRTFRMHSSYIAKNVYDNNVFLRKFLRP